MHYICTYRGALRMWDPRTHWSVEAYMPFWTEEKQAGVWDFKGKAGSSQVNKKRASIWKTNSCQPTQNHGTQMEAQQTKLLGFTVSVACSLQYDTEVNALFL